MKCPTCKGTGKVKWDFNEFGSKTNIREVGCPDPRCMKGEQGMSEKLTRDEFSTYWERGTTEARYELWSRFGADREAVRAEVREEILKDHFKIGEAVLYDSATDASERNGHIRIIDDVSEGGGDDNFVVWEHNARRPAKKQALTRQEKVQRLLEYRVFGASEWGAHYVSDDTINDLCRVYKVLIEVDE